MVDPSDGTFQGVSLTHLQYTNLPLVLVCPILMKHQVKKWLLIGWEVMVLDQTVQISCISTYLFRRTADLVSSIRMLSQVGYLLGIFKLPYLMEKYGTPFFAVDKIMGNLFTMEAGKMVLIPKNVTYMPQVSDIRRTCPLDQSQTFNLLSENATDIALLMAMSTMVLQPSMPYQL